MKKAILSVVAIVLILSAFSFQQRPVYIYMAGDSTMADKVLYKVVFDSITGDSISEPFPERGWGRVLPQFFNDQIIVKNYAKNGRSTRTFINEGLWDSIYTQVKTGDYVVIQFGHNDSSKEKVDRYTSPEDYKKNLECFVDDVKSKGGIPILCTSVVRRKFDKDGHFQDSHGEYLDIVKQVAKEKKTLIIDMYEKSKKLITDLGDERSKLLFLHLNPGDNRNFPKGVTDNTHFNDTGAKMMASLFIDGLKEEKVTSLTDLLKKK